PRPAGDRRPRRGRHPGRPGRPSGGGRGGRAAAAGGSPGGRGVMRSAALTEAPVGQALGAALVALPAALPAAFWAGTVEGRPGGGGLPARWTATFLAGLFAVPLWALLTDGGRPARVTCAALLAAAALCAAVLAALYGSETAYHRFVHEPVVKGVALPASVALVLLAPAFGAGLEALGAARRGAPAGGRPRAPRPAPGRDPYPGARPGRGAAR